MPKHTDDKKPRKRRSLFDGPERRRASPQRRLWEHLKSVRAQSNEALAGEPGTSGPGAPLVRAVQSLAERTGVPQAVRDAGAALADPRHEMRDPRDPTTTTPFGQLAKLARGYVEGDPFLGLGGEGPVGAAVGAARGGAQVFSKRLKNGKRLDVSLQGDRFQMHLDEVPAGGGSLRYNQAGDPYIDMMLVPAPLRRQGVGGGVFDILKNEAGLPLVRSEGPITEAGEGLLQSAGLGPSRPVPQPLAGSIDEGQAAFGEMFVHSAPRKPDQRAIRGEDGVFRNAAGEELDPQHVFAIDPATGSASPVQEVGMPAGGAAGDNVGVAAHAAQPEIVKRAAVRSEDGQVFEGAHHGEALQRMRQAGVRNRVTGETDGFVTSTGRFVDREEAAQLARDAQQLRKTADPETAYLVSEDVKPDQLMGGSPDPFGLGAEGRAGDSSAVAFRSAYTAPDLGPEVEQARRELFERVQEYSMRPENAAPAGEFGTAKLLGRGEYDEGFAKKVAEAYEGAKSTPDDPAVRASYEQFGKEVEEQFDFVTNELGVKFLPGEADPYKNSTEMMEDLFKNRQLRVFSGGEPHPLLTHEQNVKFRFVHDVLGHGLYGNSFGKVGEENAFRAHSELFSKPARGAMASETRGQNSWVNYGPHGEHNRAKPAETIFAEQKAFLLPEEMHAPVPRINTVDSVTDDILQRAQANPDGFTLNPRSGELYDPSRGGYGVAPSKSTELRVSPDDRDAVRAWVAKHWDDLQKDGNYGGGWLNEETGEYILDVSRIVPDLDEALRIGQDGRQLAVFDFANMKSVPVPLGPPRVDAIGDARRRARRTEEGRPRNRARLERDMMEGMTPYERQRYEQGRADLRKNVLDNYAKLPEPEVFAHAILGGADQRGWYDTATKAIHEAFGDDAPRFAALLAATSPQMAVAPNLDVALDIWEKWVRAGRPTGVDEVAGLLPAQIRGVAGVKNPHTALTAPLELLRDPSVLSDGGLLSGPKVDPFYGALMGETHRVVNDTHMARGYGTSPNDVGTLGRVLPQNAMMGNAVRHAGDAAGVPFSRAEGQETAWSWIRALTERLTTPRHSAEELVRGGVDLSEGITATPGFGGLLGTPERSAVLERLGLPQPRIRNPQGTPTLDRKLIEPASLQNIAQRIDAIRRNQPLYGAGAIGLGAGAAAAGLLGEREEPRRRRPGLF